MGRRVEITISRPHKCHDGDRWLYRYQDSENLGDIIWRCHDGGGWYGRTDSFSVSGNLIHVHTPECVIERAPIRDSAYFLERMLGVRFSRGHYSWEDVCTTVAVNDESWSPMFSPEQIAFAKGRFCDFRRANWNDYVCVEDVFYGLGEPWKCDNCGGNFKEVVGTRENLFSVINHYDHVLGAIWRETFVCSEACRIATEQRERKIIGWHLVEEKQRQNLLKQVRSCKGALKAARKTLRDRERSQRVEVAAL